MFSKGLNKNVVSYLRRLKNQKELYCHTRNLFWCWGFQYTYTTTTRNI